MSIAINFDIPKSAPPVLQTLMSHANPMAVSEVAARAITNLVRESLFTYGQQNPNQLGGTRTNFFGDAAKATNSKVSTDQVLVQINHIGIRLQILGGIIKPGRGISKWTGKPTRMLTIPASAEAHGYRAAEFDNLVMLWREDGAGKFRPYALAESGDGQRSGKELTDVRKKMQRDRKKWIKQGKPSHEPHKATAGPFNIIFWLVGQATIKPHPDILPKTEEMIGAALKALEEFLTK